MAGSPVDDRHESCKDVAVKAGAVPRWAQFYACPNCKSALVEANGGLRCASCDRFYSVVDDIPEFIAGKLSASADPQLRRMRFIDKMAGFYESQLWYPVVMKVYGGLRAPLLPQLIHAIAGILGAFIVTDPTARINTIVPIGCFPLFLRLPALLVIGVWAAIQFVNGFGSLSPRVAAGGDGTAYFAHIGGFCAGVLAIGLFRRSAGMRGPRS